jgi:hypothetical protein
MALFNPPELRAGYVEDIGSTSGDASSIAATLRRIWKLGAFRIATGAGYGKF